MQENRINTSRIKTVHQDAYGACRSHYEQSRATYLKNALLSVGLNDKMECNFFTTISGLRQQIVAFDWRPIKDCTLETGHIDLKCTSECIEMCKNFSTQKTSQRFSHYNKPIMATRIKFKHYTCLLRNCFTLEVLLCPVLSTYLSSLLNTMSSTKKGLEPSTGVTDMYDIATL